MMLMMRMKNLKLIITSKYIAIEGDLKVIYVVYGYYFTKLLYVFSITAPDVQHQNPAHLKCMKCGTWRLKQTY